ncbi:MAG: hypothetical protein WCK82_15370, partial [Bacteroidota bacterium]
GGAGGGTAGWAAVGPPPVPRRAGNGGRGGDSPYGGDGGSLDAGGALVISSGDGNLQVGGGLYVNPGVSGGPLGAGIGGVAGKGALALDPNPNPLGTQHRANDGVAGAGGNIVGGNLFGTLTQVRLEAQGGAVGDGGSGFLQTSDLLVRAKTGISLTNTSNQVSRVDLANSGAGNIAFTSSEFLDIVGLSNAQGSAGITGAAITVSGNINLQNASGAKDLTLKASAFDVTIHASTINAGTVTTYGHTIIDGTVTINAPLTVNGALDITTINAFRAQSLNAGDIYNASVDAVIGGNVTSSGSIDNIGNLSAQGISAAGDIRNDFGSLSAGGTISAGGNLSNGFGSIDANGNVTAGGTLANAGNLTLTGGTVTADRIEWTGGTITASSIDIANGGSIANGVTLNAPLNLNGGSIDFAAANLGGSGTVVLGAAASMRVTGSTAINNTGGLVNNGVIAVDADNGDASLTVNGDFTNNTTLTLTSSNSGGNAKLAVSGGSFFNSGTLDVQAGAGGTRSIQAGSFEHQGTGRIQGDGVLDIDAPFSWTGGAGVIASGVEVRLNQGGSMISSQGVIDGVLRNAGGTLQLVDATVSGTGRLANDAKLEFGGTGSIVNVPVEGSGNLDVL